jgi:hypothetical protein
VIEGSNRVGVSLPSPEVGDVLEIRDRGMDNIQNRDSDINIPS